MSMKNVCLVASAAFVFQGLAIRASAGQLVADAIVERVASIDGNAQRFAIKTAGGSGLCTATWISFPASAFPDIEAFRRSFAAALAAQAQGMRVVVHNYANDNCNGATYIEIYR